MATKGLWGSASLPLTTVCEGAQALWWPCVPSGSPGPLASTACAAVRRPKIFLLFVPGNPGLPTYYIDYLTTIHAHPLLRGKVEILAVGHVGHTPWPRTSPLPGPQATGLRDQIAQKVRIIDRVRAMYPRAPMGTEGDENEVDLVLCGHSVGSYILLEVLKQRVDQLDGLHLLFPTVAHIGEAPNAAGIRVIASTPIRLVLQGLCLLLSMLPYYWLAFLVHVVTRQPLTPSAAETTATLLSTPGVVGNALKMALEEFEQIRSVPAATVEALTVFTHPELGESSGTQRRKPGVVRTYWAAGNVDHWVPERFRTHAQEVLKLLPARTPVVHAAPHVHGVPDTESQAIVQALTHEGEAAAGPASETKQGAGSSETDRTDDEVEGKQDQDGPSGEDDGKDKGQRLPVRTATVCEVGMPHAFCLEYAAEMGRISAHWLAHDHGAGFSEGTTGKAGEP